MNKNEATANDVAWREDEKKNRKANNFWYLRQG